MKRYKHKPTGDIYTTGYSDYYVREGQISGEIDSIPTRIVESGKDWELIPEEWPIGTVIIHPQQKYRTYTKTGKDQWTCTLDNISITDETMIRVGWKPAY